MFESSCFLICILFLFPCMIGFKSLSCSDGFFIWYYHLFPFHLQFYLLLLIHPLKCCVIFTTSFIAFCHDSCLPYFMSGHHIYLSQIFYFLFANNRVPIWTNFHFSSPCLILDRDWLTMKWKKWRLFLLNILHPLGNDWRY